MNKFNENISYLNKRKLSKKAQEREYETKTNLQMENQNRNNCKFQIHWNKLEWVNRKKYY